MPSQLLPCENGYCVLLKGTSTAAVTGVVSISVVSGAANINGRCVVAPAGPYLIALPNLFAPVFIQKWNGPLPPRPATHSHSVGLSCEDPTIISEDDRKLWNDIISNDKNHVAVVIQYPKQDFPSFYRDVFSPPEVILTNTSQPAPQGAQKEQTPSQLGLYQRWLLDAASISQEQGPIACLGAQGTGKSSFLRILANTVLNNHGRVDVLDLDVGQSELWPHGLISCTRLIDAPPLVGSSVSSIGGSHPCSRFLLTGRFYGSPSPRDDPYLFNSCLTSMLPEVSALTDFSEAPGPLLINWHGWTTVTAAESIDIVLDALRPSHIVEMSGKHLLPIIVPGMFANIGTTKVINEPAVTSGEGVRQSNSLITLHDELEADDYITRPPTPDGQHTKANQRPRAAIIRDVSLLQYMLGSRGISTLFSGAPVADPSASILSLRSAVTTLDKLTVLHPSYDAGAILEFEASALLPAQWVGLGPPTLTGEMPNLLADASELLHSRPPSPAAGASSQCSTPKPVPLPIAREIINGMAIVHSTGEGLVRILLPDTMDAAVLDDCTTIVLGLSDLSQRLFSESLSINYLLPHGLVDGTVGGKERTKRNVKRN